eukprot:CAMPEP_0198533710 /NCGR_PEP_ID=MMETSP1462-20131121/34564_1 /TAXON_ID=1333877 /ORGANISM="Brandtodinium nutriculum, Strain RCC3387" /LENGTH=74 /DNA_ID=CAMNT_0044263623 /DNA_START=64 /DNA_END=284 /DNA_ORIENTATION=-
MGSMPAANFQAALRDLFFGELLGLDFLDRLLHSLVLLLQDHLDVARAIAIRSDAAVGAIRPAAALLRLAHLDVV